MIPLLQGNVTHSAAGHSVTGFAAVGDKEGVYLWPELFKPSLLGAVHRQELTGYPKESEIYPINNQTDRRASWQSDYTRNVDGLNGCHAPNAFCLAG